MQERGKRPAPAFLFSAPARPTRTMAHANDGPSGSALLPDPLDGLRIAARADRRQAVEIEQGA